MVDQVRATLGEFEGVSAGLTTVADRHMTAEDSYTVHFRLRSGVEGVMQSTAGAWGPPLFTTRIAGRAGTLWVDFDTVCAGLHSGLGALWIDRETMIKAFGWDPEVEGY